MHNAILTYIWAKLQGQSGKTDSALQVRIPLSNTSRTYGVFFQRVLLQPLEAALVQTNYKWPEYICCSSALKRLLTVVREHFGMKKMSTGI